MIRIGLTGGIGSGKSYVARIFKALGVPVFLADEAGRQAYLNPDIRQAVIRLMGAETYFQTDQPNRKKIAELVFQDAELLNRLNAIIHPWVKDAFEQFADKVSDAPYLIKEAAILFESGAQTGLDAVICVCAPDDLRLSRVLSRDQLTKSEVLRRMNNQWPQEKIQQLSDYLILNDGTKLVVPQVLKIHEEISKRL